MIKATVEGKKLTIVADLDGTEFSGSGKNINLATTGGFVQVDNKPEYRFALNVITKPPKK